MSSQILVSTSLCPSLFSTSLEWSRLTATEDTPWINASEILLGSCVDLFKKGLISTALELIAGVGSFHGSYRYAIQALT